LRPLPAAKTNEVMFQLREGRSARQVTIDACVSVSFTLKTHWQDKENIPEFKAGRPSKASKRTKSVLNVKTLLGQLLNLKDTHGYII
ncbi:hypothetical protein DFQ27_009800, partial [Actinomortierella ambigua]